MAHFAEIDGNGIVKQVLVVPDQQEHRGQDYLANDLGLGGTWIQTSYNHRIRKQYAGIGFKYDAAAEEQAKRDADKAALEAARESGKLKLSSIGLTEEEIKAFGF